MFSGFEPRQRRAIVVFGSIWVLALGFFALGVLLGG
jgi:hypothetical protein